MRNIRDESARTREYPSKAVALLLTLTAFAASAASSSLLNVSFDVSRELFRQINPAFVEYWKAKTGEAISINQSHDGSGKQSRAVIDGLQADVVTFNQATDIDAISQKSGVIPANWRTLLPDNSTPYFSTIVFLVRKGNPKHIKDWNDLGKAGVSVIVPNPKTSGNGRYSYLAAFAFALNQPGKSKADAQAFVGAVFKNVPVFDTGGRGALTTFAQREMGDVLLTFEADARLAIKDNDKFELITPSQSIVADMPVAVVKKFAKQHHTEQAARAYLEFLYTESAQEIIARNFYRPRSKAAAPKYERQFPNLKLVTVEEVFGDWTSVQKQHFADGGTYDQIFSTRN